MTEHGNNEIIQMLLINLRGLTAIYFTYVINLPDCEILGIDGVVLGVFGHHVGGSSPLVGINTIKYCISDGIKLRIWILIIVIIIRVCTKKMTVVGFASKTESA